MSEQGEFNRSARRSGGYRPTQIHVPKLSRDDIELMAQEAAIRAEFGEEGVKRFWDELQRRAAESPPEEPSR